MRVLFVVLFSLLIPCFAKADVTITGRVLDEQGQALQTSLKINGKKFKANDQGVFSATVSEKDIYQIRLGSKDHFPMIHSFSHYELATAKPESFTIPDITLVKKIKGRTMMVFAGDMMMGRRYAKPHPGEPVLIRPDHKAQDTKAILAPIKDYLEIADFASVNLETQILDEKPAQRAPKSVTFYTPAEAIDALNWAGVDYVTLGNNHTYDYLDQGLDYTIDILNQKNMAHSGAGRTETEALKSYIAKLADTKYALQGYVGWAGGGKPSQVAEGDNKGGPALGSMKNIDATVKRDLQDGYAPIVQYHGSLEYGEGPSRDTETRLKSAIDQGAVMAIAHHAHVFQGLEIYKGKLIAWSLGNFAFDQYFYAAQETALLYVWMDGQDFHRAEVAPVYVKGYKPTPATGEMRHGILKRIQNLSVRHGTVLTVSGGHGVVTNEPAELQKNALDYNDKQSPVALTNRPWTQQITHIKGLPKDQRYRMGRDLLSRGNFEAYNTFESPDRSWLNLDSNISITEKTAASGKTSLELDLIGNEEVITGMRKFTRVYEAGSPMTLSGMIKTDQPVKVTFYLQRRTTRAKLFDALENGPEIQLGSMTFNKNNWQSFSIDFDSPRVGTRSIRFLIEVENLSGEKAKTYLDDLAFIEWQTPYLDHISQENSPRPMDVSHIQFSPK